MINVANERRSTIPYFPFQIRYLAVSFDTRHMELSVIIVNYNVKYFLEQCLFSVRAAMQGMHGEVLVVDNASTDGSRAYLTVRFPEVRFFWNHTNLGFAKANNQALQYARGKYILFLNPDTVVPEDCFRKCVSFMEAHPDAGALGIRMLDGSGQFLPESKRSFPSLLTSFFKLSGLSRLFPRSPLFGRYHLGHLSEHENHAVEVLAGAFMMVRKVVLESVGSFDERFFMYGEDIDLSYRIRQAGYHNYYFSESFIVHFKGESTRKGSLNYVRMFYQAMSLFVQKHYRTTGTVLLRRFINLAIWLRAALSLLKRFMQRIGMPLFDAALIFCCFWLAKEIWTEWVRPLTAYRVELLRNAFTGFTLLFLVVTYYTGLYEKRFNGRKLWRSMLVALATVLALYALLPERFRFSRGMVVLGSVISFAALHLWRRLLVQWRILEKGDEALHKYTIVAGTAADHQTILQLLRTQQNEQVVKGFVSPLQEAHALGSLTQLATILASTPVSEVVVCQGPFLSFSQALHIFEKYGSQVKLRLHADGSGSVVGSDSKNTGGQVIAHEKAYRIMLPENQRLKRLSDMVFSLLLLLTAPLHVLLHPRPAGLLRNAWQVLINRKTWVGFKTHAAHLPPLKSSVISAAGIPHGANSLRYENQLLTDEWYAQAYELLNDWEVLFKSYKKLGAI